MLILRSSIFWFIFTKSMEISSRWNSLPTNNKWKNSTILANLSRCCFVKLETLRLYHDESALIGSSRSLPSAAVSCRGWKLIVMANILIRIDYYSNWPYYTLEYVNIFVSPYIHSIEDKLFAAEHVDNNEMNSRSLASS